jgi:N-acetylmuramoyl-L-alanine amidase
MEIKQMLIPSSNKKARPKIAMSPKYITLHETDNTDQGADALAHAKLQFNGNVRNASWHFQVDEREIYQSIPTNEVAWANGDGSNGTGNRESISVEICVNSDGSFEQAKQNTVWLVRYLMNKHDIPISNVVQHNRWSGKNCPRNLRQSGWSSFINQIKSGGSNTPVSNGNRILKLTTPYMTGEDVKKVQKIVGAEVDGVYGLNTMNKVTKFQKSHNLITDGIVGPNTWDALLAPPPPPFYDCVVNEASKATFSARDVDEIAEKIKNVLLKQPSKIALDKRD